MYYLRQTKRTINNIETITPLSKARLYGIAKEKYVAQVESYGSTYVTEFDSIIIKHPTLDEYCLCMESLNRLPDVFLQDLESELTADWFDKVEIVEGE